MAARVGVQRLLLRGEGVEQGEAVVARNHLVVPLEHELDRDADPARRLKQGLVARETEDGGTNPRFGRDQQHADTAAHRDAPVPHGSGDAVEFQEGVQGGLPLGHSLRGEHDVVTGHMRAEGFAIRHSLPDVGHEALVPLDRRPVPVSRRIDGRRREAARRVLTGPGQHTRCLLVLAAAMPQQHQRMAAGGVGG